MLKLFGREVAMARNMNVQILNGQEVFTVWSSSRPAGTGFGFGQIDIFDDTYQKIKTICSDNVFLNAPDYMQDEPCKLDWHENLITSTGTLLTTAFNLTTANLTSLGGAVDGEIFDPVPMEIDIATGKMVWSWNALNVVRIEDSHLPYIASFGKTFDYVHLNAIDKATDPADGTYKYLLSGRHTWSLYLVDSQGKLEWCLKGDTGGDFGPLPEEARFVSTFYLQNGSLYHSRLRPISH